MTATIKPPPGAKRRRRFRINSMEALGFFEVPQSVPTWSTATPVPVSGASQTSSTVPVPSPGEEFLADWHSAEVGSQLLKRRVRWGLALTLTLLVASLSSLAVWLYRQPEIAAAQALAQAREVAADLEVQLSALAAVNDSMLTGDQDLTQITAVLLAVDDSARALYQSSAQLSSVHSSLRTQAGDAASEALDAARQLDDVIAYRSAVIPFLTPPALETDPELISLEEAASLFGEWRAGFDRVRSALPEGVLPEVTAELTLASAGMDSIQRQYLDALRAGVPASASLAELSQRLAAVERSLEGAILDAQREVSNRIERAREALVPLLG